MLNPRSPQTRRVVKRTVAALICLILPSFLLVTPETVHDWVLERVRKRERVAKEIARQRRPLTNQAPDASEKLDDVYVTVRKALARTNVGKDGSGTDRSSRPNDETLQDIIHRIQAPPRDSEEHRALIEERQKLRRRLVTRGGTETLAKANPNLREPSLVPLPVRLREGN